MILRATTGRTRRISPESMEGSSVFLLPALEIDFDRPEGGVFTALRRPLPSSRLENSSPNSSTDSILSTFFLLWYFCYSRNVSVPAMILRRGISLFILISNPLNCLEVTSHLRTVRRIETRYISKDNITESLANSFSVQQTVSFAFSRSTVEIPKCMN